MNELRRRCICSLIPDAPFKRSPENFRDASVPRLGAPNGRTSGGGWTGDEEKSTRCRRRRRNHASGLTRK